jgi:organic radical activating enzyme
MQHLPYVEFYISHTCNLGCNGCNRFNNYTFTGHQRWNDYADDYQQWSRKLNLKHYTILGGEPMANPDMLEWILGLHKLWPQAQSKFVTNGGYTNKFNDKFYQALLETETILDIGLHNYERKSEVLKTVLSFIRHPVEIRRVPEKLSDLPGITENWKNSYDAIKDSSWPSCDSPDDWESLPPEIREECSSVHNFSIDIVSEERKGYHIIDANGLEVYVNYENFFHQGALIKQPEKNNFTLHNSNPTKAHKICHMKTCHHFIDGKLSKCGPAVLFKQFAEQFEVEINESDQKIIEQYSPASADMSEEDLAEFIKNIVNEIPQCKFCPEEYVIKEINSDIKKDKFGNKKIG